VLEFRIRARVGPGYILLGYETPGYEMSGSLIRYVNKV